MTNVIYKKIAMIQKILKAPKDSRNSHGGYMYRTASQILETAKPICGQLGLMILLRDEAVQVGGYTYIKSTAGLIDTETGESYVTTGYAREDAERKGMCASQISGAASSYARKYALCALLAIDDSRQDPDAMEPQQYQQQQQYGQYQQQPWG